MPREQETSLKHDPATSDDPLFRDQADQFRDAPAPNDRDDSAPAGATPIGDELAASRHAQPSGDATAPGDEAAVASEPAPAVTATDAPGEWVAGSKGPDYVPEQDTDAADTTPANGFPAMTSTPGTADSPATADTRATAGTAATADTAATMDTDAPATAAGTDTSPDLRTTRDPEVAPDSALAADSTPEPTAPGTTPTTSTTPDTTATAGAPGTPVPGAPGTAETTGVAAATAALVTNGDELHADWARIQSAFVDDPRGSVSQAADLVTQVTSSLVAAVQEREQTLRGAWDSQGGSDTDTEHLRTALRDYRSFFELLIGL